MEEMTAHTRAPGGGEDLAQRNSQRKLSDGAAAGIRGPLLLAQVTNDVFLPFHKRLFFMCGMSWGFAGASWFSTLQFLLPAVKGRLGIPASAQGTYPTAFYVGMALGASVLGRVSDTMGRRPALLIAILASATAGFLSAWAFDGYLLAFFLLLQGIGVGGVLPLSNLLFAEWCPAAVRCVALPSLLVLFPLTSPRRVADNSRGKWTVRGRSLASVNCTAINSIWCRCSSVVFSQYHPL